MLSSVMKSHGRVSVSARDCLFVHAYAACVWHVRACLSMCAAATPATCSQGIEGDWGSPSSSEEESSDDAEEGSSDASSSSSSSASSYKGQLNDDNRRVYVYFTRNGKKIGGIPSTIPVGGYFPTVGMRSASEAVKVFVHALSG